MTLFFALLQMLPKRIKEEVFKVKEAKKKNRENKNAEQNAIVIIRSYMKELNSKTDEKNKHL